MAYNWKQAKAIESVNKKKFLELNNELNNDSGIYMLTRIDENGFKYAYIGQAKHILTRLAQHMVGYQHIDLSLKNHGLYSDKNEYGWNVIYYNCSEEELDDKEQNRERQCEEDDFVEEPLAVKGDNEKETEGENRTPEQKPFTPMAKNRHLVCWPEKITSGKGQQGDKSK